MESNFEAVGIAGQSLINAVVDNFLGEMVGPGRIGIHSRPHSDRIKAFEDFDGIGAVVVVVIFLSHIVVLSVNSLGCVGFLLSV